MKKMFMVVLSVGLVGQHAVLGASFNEEQDKLEKLQKALDDARGKRNTAVKDLAKVALEYRKPYRKLEADRASLSQLKKRIKDAEANKSDAARIQELTGQQSKLEQEIETLKSEVEQKKPGLVRAYQKKADADNAILQARQAVDKQQRAIDDQLIAKVDASKEKQKQEIKRKEAEKKQAEKARSGKQKEVKEAEKRLETAMKKGTQKDRREARSKLKTLRAEEKELENSVARLTQEIPAVERQVKDSDRTRDQLETAKKHVGEETKRYEARMNKEQEDFKKLYGI